MTGSARGSWSVCGVASLFQRIGAKSAYVSHAENSFGLDVNPAYADEKEEIALSVRFVAVADTHLYHRNLAVPDGDVFIHAGDLAIRGDVAELAAAAAWVKSLPHALKIVIAGNHDWAFAKSPSEAQACFEDARIVYLEDSGVLVHGLRIWGSPWQPEYGGWAFNLERGAPLRARWAMIPLGTDVLVTHGPPEGHGDRCSMPGRVGCSDLLARVRQVRPLVHLFGHIHEDGGLTKGNGVNFFNVTTWECTRGATVFDIDTDARTVAPIEVPPSGSNFNPK